MFMVYLNLKLPMSLFIALSELCDHCRSLTHVVEREGGTDEHGFDQTTYEVIEEIARPGVSVSLLKNGHNGRHQEA